MNKKKISVTLIPKLWYFFEVYSHLTNESTNILLGELIVKVGEEYEYGKWDLKRDLSKFKDKREWVGLYIREDAILVIEAMSNYFGCSKSDVINQIILNFKEKYESN